MKTIIKRFSEPSTYAGLAGIAIALGMSTEGFDTIINAVAGLFGFIAVALGEGEG